MSNLTFGQALEHIKNGVPMQRKGWNGKGMFVFQRQGFIQPKNPNQYQNRFGDKVTEFLREKEQVEFTPVLCMWTADQKVVTGWLASQTDILAEDWQTAF